MNKKMPKDIRLYVKNYRHKILKLKNKTQTIMVQK